MKEQQPLYTISKQTLKRLPDYYNFLKGLQRKGVRNVSSPIIAKNLSLNEVQVRKDLAAVSESGGRPKTGFDIEELIQCMEHCLGYDNVTDAILIGCGKLGMALLSYPGFVNCGVRIVAAFDNNMGITGISISGRPVFPMKKLPGFLNHLKVRIGIITVPAEDAQEVCDALVENGILAIWNFAPVHLEVPYHILVQNENMAISLAMLSKHLREQMGNDRADANNDGSI